MRRNVERTLQDIALHDAARMGNLAAAREAIAGGADVNSQDEEHYTTPLQWAAAFGQTDVVRFLLDAGGDVSYADENGDTPLGSAVGNGHLEIARLLLERGADVTVEDFGGRPPLFSAIALVRQDLVKLLLQAGADVNYRIYNGSTPLMEAAETGDLDLLRLLIQNGAGVTHADGDRRTAADYARDAEHYAAAAFLEDASE
ncbi:MAG: ankyrin repeat domain-containing protein [Capsulimonas sp.]|uniref:ankyrin repeat domain-containing protein n=1 Tax=Capsulimonas sp. TaxID=2494211 RepID=UPI00326473FA